MNQHLPVGTKATEHRLVANVAYAEDPSLSYRPSFEDPGVASGAAGHRVHPPIHTATGNRESRVRRSAVLTRPPSRRSRLGSHTG